MIVLTSSEPKAAHGWGGMGCVGRGTPTKKTVFDTQRKMAALHEEVISFGFTAPLFNSKKPHDKSTQREDSNYIIKDTYCFVCLSI